MTHNFSEYTSNFSGYSNNSSPNQNVAYNNPFLQSVSALASYAAAVGYGANNNNYMLNAFSERHSQKPEMPAATNLLQSQKYYQAWQQYYNSNLGITNSLTPSSKSSISTNKTKLQPEPIFKKEKLTSDHPSKKKEFEQLSKARTDKLLADGPISSSESVSSTPPSKPVSPPKIPQPAPINPQIKLIQMVLDQKKRSLFKSPLIRSVLRKRQKTIEIYKKRTELFSVTMMAQHQAVLNLQRQQQVNASLQYSRNYQNQGSQKS